MGVEREHDGVQMGSHLRPLRQWSPITSPHPPIPPLAASYLLESRRQATIADGGARVLSGRNSGSHVDLRRFPQRPGLPPNTIPLLSSGGREASSPAPCAGRVLLACSPRGILLASLSVCRARLRPCVLRTNPGVAPTLAIRRAQQCTNRTKTLASFANLNLSTASSGQEAVIRAAGDENVTSAAAGRRLTRGKVSPFLSIGSQPSLLGGRRVSLICLRALRPHFSMTGNAPAFYHFEVTGTYVFRMSGDISE